jgi:hypothetical protein
VTGDIYATGSLSADSIKFNTEAGITPGVGELTWNADEESLDYGVNSDVTLQIGQEQLIHVKAEEDIKNGQAVYASGASGTGSGNITVRLYRAGAGDIEELYFIGVATQDIATNEFGFVSTFGKVRGVKVADTRASDDPQALSANNEGWDIGTILYVSPAEAGKYTQTKPVAPDKDIPVVMIISENGNQRTFFTRYEHGYHLSEIHDVLYNEPIGDGDLLTWNGSISAWENQPETDPVFSSWAQSVSSNYESTYTTVNINSADWTYVAANSASGSNVSGLSSNWENTYTTVNTNSADWAYVAANSGTGGSGGSDVSDLSGNWENTYNTVQSTSSTWGGGGSGEAVTKSITQVAHGFSVGDVLYDNAGTWAKAQADTAIKSEVIGMVSSTTTNAFDLTTHGYVSGLTGLSADQMYFLDASTAGAITATEPSTTGQVSKPVFWSVSTTAGYVINYRGLVIPSPATTGGQVPNYDSTYTTVQTNSSDWQTAYTNVQSNSAGWSSGAISITIDGAGSVITTGTKGVPKKIPYTGTINSVEIVADQTGTVVVDIWKDTYANYPPTVADSIVGAAYPTLSGEIKSQDNTLIGWTTTINKGDYIIFNVRECSTITQIELTLDITKNG